MTNDPAARRSLFVVVAPGLERLAADELRALGIAPTGTETGGVACEATARELYAMHLHLRTASRVVARVAEFHASEFHELERHVRRVDWRALIAPDTPVEVTATCRKSKLYHSDAVAERVGKFIVQSIAPKRAATSARATSEMDFPAREHPNPALRRHPNPALRRQLERERRPGTRERTGSIRSRHKLAQVARESPHETPAPEPTSGPPQLVIVRLVHDQCMVSLDASGELLHVRGYRQAVGKAPLRETLAAAMLLASGWNGSEPLVDPLSGSGTIAIEAALLARRIPPGLARAESGAFAFVRWPDFDADAWASVIDEAREGILPTAPGPIAGSDRDAGAVESAIANAERAGVAGDVTFTRAALSAAELPGDHGWIVTNPPYGVRVGDRDHLRDLYAALGALAREHGGGWRITALLGGEPRLEAELARALGAPLVERFRSANGGIPVRLLVSGEATGEARS